MSGADDPLLAERARSEGRVLVTLDLGFANVQTYDPGIHTGIIVLRLNAAISLCTGPRWLSRTASRMANFGLSNSTESAF